MEDKDVKNDDNFKVPLLISKVGNDTIVKVNAEKEKSTTYREHENSKVNAVLPYKEPSWSGTPPANYMFQVIKSGVIISNFQIQKSCIVIGRLTTCDIALEHPSVSRYHAVVQYCSGTDKYQKGFYVYDLGSTHGTFLNKKQIEANTYYLVKIDNILKFGGSTRLHILLGPEDVSEDVKVAEEKSVEVNTEESCSWGLSEDADEEDDLSVNPFAITTENEALYIDDPKKTLRGWYEREGYELEYNVEEKGFRTFACNIRLPIDTPTGDYLLVEASVNGKKKEAVVACALEACRTLDRHGLLRQSHHESRERKQKKWEDEDFYDSDEDTYLDRTGTIEKKRQFRMKTMKKSEPETFSSLETKLKGLKEKISIIEMKLQVGTSINSSKTDPSKDDPLDSYMCEIKKESVDKVTKSKLKLDHAELLKERSRLEKLLNIVKPTQMPVKKFPNMIGKKIKSKLKLPEPCKKRKIVSKEINDPEIEEDEEMDQESDKEQKDCIKEVIPIIQKDCIKEVVPIIQKDCIKEIVPIIQKDCIKEVVPIIKETISSSIPDIRKEKCSKLNPDISETVQIKPPTSKPKPLETNSVKQSVVHAPKEKAAKKIRSAKGKDVYSGANENYSMWVPPTNQSGDGSTHLNAKYGY